MNSLISVRAVYAIVPNVDPEHAKDGLPQNFPRGWDGIQARVPELEVKEMAVYMNTPIRPFSS